jgi:hypothetical protein
MSLFDMTEVLVSVLVEGLGNSSCRMLEVHGKSTYACCSTPLTAKPNVAVRPAKWHISLEYIHHAGEGFYTTDLILDYLQVQNQPNDHRNRGPCHRGPR